MEWLRRLWHIVAKTSNTERLAVLVAIAAIIVPYLIPHPPTPTPIPWPLACDRFTNSASQPIEERYQAIADQVDARYKQLRALRDKLNFSEPETFDQRERLERETVYPLSVCARQLVDTMDLPPKIESKLAAFVSTRIGYRDSDWKIAHQYADRAIKADRYNHLALIAKAATSFEAFMHEHRFENRDDVFYVKAKDVIENSIQLLFDSIKVVRTREAHFMLDRFYRLAGMMAAKLCQKDEATMWLSSARTNAKLASEELDDKEVSKHWTETLETLESAVIQLPESCPHSKALD